MTAPTTVTITARDADVLRQAAEHLRSKGDPPIGSMSVRSDEVRRVARSLMDQHPRTFGHLDQWSVVHIEDAHAPKRGCKAIARPIIVPPVYQQLYGDDLVIAVSAEWWAAAGEHERQGGLYHAMYHVYTAVDDDTGEAVGLRTRNHDSEVFFDELAHLGAWRTEIRTASQQLGMFDDSTSR